MDCFKAVIMYFYILFFIIFELGIVMVSGDNCTSFKTNINDIPNELFKEINGQFGKLMHDFIDSNGNLDTINNIYKEYLSKVNNEDIHLNITQLLTKYGYPVEEHEVKTSDGYLLTIFRIPNDGPPVYLMHGVFSSSDDFITIGPDSGLAYLLADAGYDVWLGNARGNKHSRRHVSLSPSCAEFWDFSWNEIGIHDLPATIDYILNETKEDKLIYIGHSQGSTAYFVLCSELPEYNDKIKLMIALSAVAFWPPYLPIIKLSSRFNQLETLLFKEIGLYELFPRNELTSYFTDTFCGTPALATLICSNAVSIFNGFDFNFPQINATALPVIYGHTPAGAATKQQLHYIQIGKSGKFAKYDYGTENIVKYGSLLPPIYPIEKITAPMAIYYSLNDRITPYKSVKKLISKLKIVPKITKVHDDKFTHTDYLFAKDVKKLLYNDVLDLIYQSL